MNSVEHPALSENLVKLLVAAYEGTFGGRFKVNVGPGKPSITIGQFEMTDLMEIRRILGEAQHHELAEPPEVNGVKKENGAWTLTHRGMAEAEFHGARRKPD